MNILGQLRQDAANAILGKMRWSLLMQIIFDNDVLLLESCSPLSGAICARILELIILARSAQAAADASLGKMRRSQLMKSVSPWGRFATPAGGERRGRGARRLSGGAGLGGRAGQRPRAAGWWRSEEGAGETAAGGSGRAGGRGSGGRRGEGGGRMLRLPPGGGGPPAGVPGQRWAAGLWYS